MSLGQHMSGREQAPWVAGTVEPAPQAIWLTAGPLRLSLTAGAVSGLFVNGVEVIRAIDYPIRDPDWGTAVLTEILATTAPAGDGQSYHRRFRGGGFDGEFHILLDPAGVVDLRLALVAEQAVRVSRAGFVVLHPLSVAGGALTVTHPDGSRTESHFPTLINPTHPAMDIAGLDHDHLGQRVQIAFEGEIFEMEDQRNWSDASFKTYCRPLLRPYPFQVAAGDTIAQRIVVTLGRGRSAAVPAAPRVAPCDRMPAIGLAIDPSVPQAGRAGPASTLLPALPRVARVDAALDRDLDWLARQGGPLDLEIVTDGAPAALRDGLARVAGVLDRAGITAGRVTALPRAFLRCIQPWEPQPAGASILDAAQAAAIAFPRASIGTGVLTNFTELNRARPPLGAAGFVTLSLTPLVHAADDASVMATLDALAPIAATLRDIYPQAPLRLGLAAVGMRSNPYGADVAANPQQGRIAMAGVDPRHRGLFGAAFAVGVAASPLAATAEMLVLGAPYGRFGIAIGAADWPQPPFDDRPDLAVTPLWHVIRGLAALVGLPRAPLALPAGLHGVAAWDAGHQRLIVANCSAEPVTLPLPSRARLHLLDETTAETALADPLWLDRGGQPAAEDVMLRPCAIAFVEQEAGGADAA